MNAIYFWSLFLLMSASMTSRSKASEPLSLEQYKKQVTQLNLNYKAGVLLQQSFGYRMAEADLDYMPSLVGNVSYTDDRRIQNSPVLFGSETVNESALLGVQTKLRTGTLVNFGYNWGYQNIYGSQFPIVGPYTAAPALTITQPLWRDFNAALSKANAEAKISAYRVQSLTTQFTNQNVLYTAESVYWRLALTRQLVHFDEEAIDRTGKILKWSRNRVSMNVADRTDSLQSEAALKQRELQFATDKEQLRQISSQFNSLRNVQGDSVTEEILPIDSQVEIKVTKGISRLAERLDTLANVQNAENQKALAAINKETVKPDISLFGTAQFNGRGGTVGSAMGESWNADNPTYTAGVKLTIPLDGGLINRINQGYNAAALAADMSARRARFDLDQDWNDLQKKLTDAISRLKLAKELEHLQMEKLKHERVRFSTGRTTNFQVLQFEDNYSDAQTALLRIQNEIISDYSQALLYNGGSL